MITSVNNPIVKSVTKLHQKKFRDQSESFLVIGTHEINEALKKSDSLHVFSLDETYTQVSPHVMKKMASGLTPDVLGVFKKLESHKIRHKVLVLENLQDPGNVGSLLRSAVGFGFTDVIAIGGIDLYHPKVISSSEGYFFHLNVNILTFEEALKALRNHHHILTTLKGSERKVLKKPLALWLGNEGSGLSKEALNLTGTHWNVKTEKVESLNVAVAGSIIMHALKDV